MERRCEKRQTTLYRIDNCSLLDLGVNISGKEGTVTNDDNKKIKAIIYYLENV